MKTIIPLLLAAACLAACNSKTKTVEHRGNPARAITYGGFVQQRTEQLQQMGGPFKDRAAARQKAEEEANSRFGGSSDDSITTTWSKNVSKAEAQGEFTDKLNDMERDKRTN